MILIIPSKCDSVKTLILFFFPSPSSSVAWAVGGGEKCTLQRQQGTGMFQENGKTAVLCVTACDSVISQNNGRAQRWLMNENNWVINTREHLFGKKTGPFKLIQLGWQVTGRDYYWWAEVTLFTLTASCCTGKQPALQAWKSMGQCASFKGLAGLKWSLVWQKMCDAIGQIVWFSLDSALLAILGSVVLHTICKVKWEVLGRPPQGSGR